MRNKALVAAAAAATVGAVLVVALAAPERPRTCLRHLVPAYFAPGTPGGWDELLSGATPGAATVIINPASGPGPAAEPRYARVVAAARARDVEVVGYVNTSFGSRPVPEVEADVERYGSWYDVDGVFLDEASSAPADLPYYRGLASFVRASGESTLILNPGRVPDEGYMAVADVVVTFEGTRRAYAAASFPAWTDGYGAGRFAHLVHDAGVAGPAAVERVAAGRHVANVYVTDDAGTNPWDTLGASFREASARLANCGIPVA